MQNNQQTICHRCNRPIRYCTCSSQSRGSSNNNNNNNPNNQNLAPNNNSNNNRTSLNNQHSSVNNPNNNRQQVSNNAPNLPNRPSVRTSRDAARIEKCTHELVSMGFNRKAAEEASERYDGDIEKASNYIVATPRAEEKSKLAITVQQPINENNMEVQVHDLNADDNPHHLSRGINRVAAPSISTSNRTVSFNAVSPKNSEHRGSNINNNPSKFNMNNVNNQPQVIPTPNVSHNRSTSGGNPNSNQMQQNQSIQSNQPNQNQNNNQGNGMSPIQPTRTNSNSSSRFNTYGNPILSNPPANLGNTQSKNNPNIDDLPSIPVSQLGHGNLIGPPQTNPNLSRGGSVNNSRRNSKDSSSSQQSDTVMTNRDSPESSIPLPIPTQRSSTNVNNNNNNNISNSGSIQSTSPSRNMPNPSQILQYLSKRPFPASLSSEYRLEQVRKLQSGELPFNQSSYLDVRDSLGKWLEAEVIRTGFSAITPLDDFSNCSGPRNFDNQWIRVHYLLWEHKWDESIHVSSEAHRLAPFRQWSEGSEHPQGQQQSLITQEKPNWFKIGEEIAIFYQEKPKSVSSRNLGISALNATVQGKWVLGKIKKLDGLQCQIEVQTEAGTRQRWAHLTTQQQNLDFLI